MKKISLIAAILMSITFARADIYTGTCGENVSWSLNTEDSTLHISGTGNMEDYSVLGTSAPYLTYGAIKYVNISEGITSIGEDAFRNCSHLEHINIPTTITSIGDHAFMSCTSLHNVVFPNGLRTIGGSTFSLCTALDSIIIPNSVDFVGTGAFQGCSAAKKLKLSNQLTTIKFAAFDGCCLIPSIEIYEGVTLIEDGAFNHCSSVKTITLPSTLETINMQAFSQSSYNTTLESITCYALNPPYVTPYEIVQLGPYTTKTGGVFFNVHTDIPLYVPAASVPLYQVADQWKDFIVTVIPDENNATRIYEPSSSRDSITSQKFLIEGDIYILRGDRTYTVTGQELR